MSEKLKKLSVIFSNGKLWASIFMIVAIGFPTLGKELVSVSDQFAAVASALFTVFAVVTGTLSESPIKKGGEDGNK